MLPESWQSLTTQNRKKSWNKLWPLAEVIQEKQETREITEITNLLKSIPGLEGINKVNVNDWLEKWKMTQMIQMNVKTWNIIVVLRQVKHLHH